MTGPYASFLDTTSDLGGQSHAAWNENGVLLHAVWDPVACRWGEAAQIANATAARNVQLTPGRTTGSGWRPLLLASWESGEANNADLFLSVGFYEGDGRLVWSDVLPIRANGQADRNHRVGVAPNGAFLISNEVRQDSGDPLSLDAAYQDSEIATTELEVKQRQAADGVVKLAADQRSTIPILELAQGERLLRVQANGQWFNLVDGQSVALPRLGALKLSAQRLEFSPDPALRASQGSVRFTFEKTTTDNLLRRGSFEVFGGDSSSDGNQQEQQSYQLQFREPRPSGGAFETQPIGFSQAINRERITRDAFASLVPRRGGNSGFRELGGDGLFGDRAGLAVGRKLSLAATPLLAQAETPLFDDLRTGDGAAMDPLTGPSLQATALTQAETKRYQQTYRDSFTWGTQAKGQVVGPIDGSISVGGTFFDRYELRPGLQTIWNITFEDISKAVDGATFPIAGFGAKLGSNFQISLSGSTNYLRDKTTVGYRSRLSLALGNAIQYGDNRDSSKAPLSVPVFSKRRNRIRSQAEPSFLGLKSTAAGNRGSGLTIQAGGLFGVPYLQRLSLTGQTIAKYRIASTSEGTQIERNPAFALWSIGIGATFGKEIRWKLAGGQSFLGADDNERTKNNAALGEFTLLQLRASATAPLLLRGGAARQDITLNPGEGSTVLDYKTDLSSARLSWMDDATRNVFNGLYWTNVVLKAVGAAGNLKTEFLPARTALLPGGSGGALARYGSGALGVIADVPWIVAFGQGINEIAAGESVNGASAFLQFDGALQLAAEASLFNRTIGAKASTGLLLDLGVSGIGKDPNFFASLKGYFRLLYTLLGIDYTIVNAQATIFELWTDPEPLLRTAVATAPTGSIGPAGGSVRLIDYVPTAVAALGPAGLNPALRPEVGGWRQVDLVGEAGELFAGDSAAPGNSGGRLVRAVIVLPEASAFDPADLNPDGSLRELRLQLSSPGALQVVIDRRAFSAQPLAYGSPQPWQELLRDGTAATPERSLSSAVISGARPGDRIPVYLDRRAELDAAGQAPELRIGLSVGASGRPLATGGLLEPAMPDSPTLSQRQGSSYVLGVQDIPRPQGASQTTTPYLAGLLLQSAGSGYRGNFDFVIDTGAGQGAQARALISPSEAGFIDALLLVRPGEAASTQELDSFRQTLETRLVQTPFAARLASGTDARVTVNVNLDGTIRGLSFRPQDLGSGYLGGGSGSFYQRLDSRQLGAGRELLFKVAVRDGLATSAVLLSSGGVFTPGELFTLNNDASGGGQGAALLPVVRDWRLLNLVDEQDIAIGSDLRFQSDGELRSGAWLTYTQGAPIGAEDKPISSQGARIDQPVRIGRFDEGNWKPYALPPQVPGLPAPGVSGFNINPVIAELTGTSDEFPDQVLVFSHSDTSMIRSEDDLYLLDQALVRSDLYYSYRTDKSRDSFPAARRLPVELPADVTLGLTNNRPYLTPFDNSGGARINPAARDLPPSVLLAWLSSSTPQSFDDDVTIAVTIGESNGSDITWSPVDLIDPGDGISNDDIVNLSLTYQDGLPVLSWSVLTDQPYRAQVLEDEPQVYLRLDEPSGSDSIEALGALAGSSGQLVRADQLADYSSPLPFQLVAGDAGTLQSLDDGVLWDAAMGVGDPNQAMRFRAGEFLELANPLAVQALQDQQAPSGYGIELWIRPEADSQGRLLDGSILDAGLYNPAAQLPAAGSVTLPFELVRQAAENELGQRGWRYVLQLKADTQANLTGVTSRGLSPYNLASLLQAQVLRASFGGVEQSFELPELLLNGALTYQTRNGALSNLFSGPAATELWQEFRADASVSAEQVRQGLSSEPVGTNPLPLRFEQIQGWSLRQQNGELVFTWGESGDGTPLALSSTALKAGEWNHVQIGYGFVDTYASLNGNTDKRASLVINGQLEASADDLGTERFLESEALIDYAGFDFNALPLQLGYGYRGDLDELAFFNAPLEDLARSSQARQTSRFVDPRSASQATFFSTGRWDRSQWDWGDPEKYTYSAYLGASEPSVNRRANGQQVIDLAGAGLKPGLRGDGFPDAARSVVLPREIPLGSRLTGIRIETDGQVFAVGEGIKTGETISGLVGVVANGTPTNALLNNRANPAELDLSVLAPGSELRLFYASEEDYRRGINPSLPADPAARVTYYYRDPEQQLQGNNTPKPSEAGPGTAAVIKNPSASVLERGSAFFEYSLVAKAIVVREAPTRLTEINSGFQVNLAAEPTARNRYADQLEVGKLDNRLYAAILNSQADLEGGSSILLLDLTATSEADLQKLRRLDAGEAGVATDTRSALQAAGVKGLRIETSDGQSIGSTLLWADLDGSGNQSLIIGNPGANGGNGEVWILRGNYLQQRIDARGGITLNQDLLKDQQSNVRRLQLSGSQADRAGFGTSLAFGKLDTSGDALVIGAPGHRSTSSERRDGAVWRLGAVDLFTDNNPELLASGETYARSGSGSLQSSGLELGTTLALAHLDGRVNPATLLVGMPGLEATYRLRNGGHIAASDDQLAYYREVLRTTAPRDSEPPASETVTVQAGGVLALDLRTPNQLRQVLVVGESFGGEAARAGEGLASGGSFDGGTADDVAIGLPEEDNGTGAVALLRGEDLRAWLAAASATQLPGFTNNDLDKGTPTNNRKVLIASTALYVHGVEAGNRLGRILRLDGNLVDDRQTGYNELVIGDPQAADGTGEIQVISGRPLTAANNDGKDANLWLDGIVFHELAVPDPEGRLTLTPGRSFAGFGSAVALANVNGTPSGGGSLDDLVMASSKLGSTLTVLYGKDALRRQDRLDLRNIASGQGLDFALSSQPTELPDGLAAFLADINGDGYGDALLGKGITSLELAYGASSEAGSSHPDAGTGGTASLDFERQLTRLQGSVVPDLPDGELKSLKPKILAVQAVGDLDGDGASELWIRSGYRDRLLEGETLGVGESLLSANRSFILTMQPDGNLVMYARASQRRVLFSLFGNRFPTFKGEVTPGSTLTVRGGQLVYVRPNGSEEVLDFRTRYTRDSLNGVLEEQQAFGPQPGTDLTGFAMLIVQDDGNLEGLGPAAPGGSPVLFSLTKAVDESVVTQPVSGAPINFRDPAAAPAGVQSLLFSGAANSNAGLAAGQVLESIEIPAALRASGIRAPGAYIGTLPLNGQQTLLFAHPDANSGVNANQLLLARPNPAYRELYADTAGLLRAWGADVRADADLNARIEQIVAAFAAPASASLDDRFAAALANTDWAVAGLEDSSDTGGRGLDFQQFLARQVPLYRLEGRTLLDPDSQQALDSPLELSLLDLTGDGSRELLIFRGKDSQAFSLKSAALAANQATAAPDILTLKANGLNGRLTNLRPIGDVDGNGHVDLIAYDNFWKRPSLWLGSVSDGRPIFNIFASLTGGTREGNAAFLAAPAGDVNGDSLDDFLVEGRDDNRNGFWLVYGQAGRDPQGFGSPTDLSLVGNKQIDLDRKINGVRLNTFIETLKDWSLSDLRGGEDVNGDGLSDIQVTLRSNLDPSSVRSYLLFGGDFTQSRTALPGGIDSGYVMQSITQLGTIGFDSLRGTPAGDSMFGREGDDLLNGQGGPDVLNGGPGNDVAIVADDQFRRVDGGPGEDALLLNGFRDQAWDLTRLASGGRLANLETIDISDFGANELRLNVAALLAITDSRRELLIEGDAPTRAPLQQLMRLLGKTNPRFGAEFDGYLDRKDITDEGLRVANDGNELAPVYGGVFADFWADYNGAWNAERQVVLGEFLRLYGRPLSIGPNGEEIDEWGPEVREAFEQALIARARPEFSSSARDSLRQQLETDLSKPHDTVLLADGPNELRLDPTAPDLVLGSDRYWVYEALNGAARLLVADGIQVRRSAEVGLDLIPTPWWQQPEAPVAAAQAMGEPVSEPVGAALFSSQAAPSIPVARARPEDQDFSVDTPVVSASEKRITFTVQRTGYGDETSRLAFRVRGYTAGLVPAAYGQVVFAPGETHRTLQVPIIKLEAGAEQLSSTEVSVELMPLEPGAPGPRRTASYAINGLNSATQTVADPVRELPAELLSAPELLRRGVGLPLSTSLTSRERRLSPASEEVVFGLSSLQGPDANEVWLRRREGGYVSIYDPSLSGELRHLQDSFEEQDGDLFIAVRDGGELDGDGQRNGTVDLTALPVLISPGAVLLNRLVLRAPSRADGQLWLELSGVAGGLVGSELLFVPVFDQEGSLPSGEQQLRPADGGYREALAAWIATDPAALRRVALTGTGVSRALELQADTDYRVLLRAADGSLRLPAIREEAASEGRFRQRLRLEAEGVELGLELSSNRWVMAGVSGADPLLVARYEPSSQSAAAPVELALVRTDGLSGGFDSDGDGTVEVRPGEAGYLSLLAARLAEDDGGVILSAQQDRALLPFTAADAVLPVLFEGISAEAWLQLPAEQRSLSGPGWRLWIDGQDGSQRMLQRQGVTRWQLTGGGMLDISLAPVLRGGPDQAAAPTRRSLGGAERLRVAALGYDEEAVSDRQVDLPVPGEGNAAPLALGSWATLDTEALAGRLWQRNLGVSAGLGAGMTPALLDLSPARPELLRGVSGPWGGTTARFYSLHGQAYDTVSLSAGAAAEQAQKPLRLTLAARISQPLLTATASGLSLRDGASSGTGQALSGAELTIQLLTTSAGPRLELLDRTYYLLADGAEAMAAAGADPFSPSRQLLERLGVRLFQTSGSFDQYFDPDGARVAETGLFRSAQQLPLGSDLRLVALEAGAAKGELLRPLSADQSAELGAVGVAVGAAVGAAVAAGEGGLRFAAADGTRLEVKLAPPAGLAEFLARDQGLVPLLNNQGSEQPVELELAISREADLNSVFGFHQVLDASGTVRDPISGALLQPGDGGYGAAALAEANLVGLPQGLEVGDRSVTQQRLLLAADTLVVPYARVESGETFFAYAPANPGGFERFRNLGDHSFGYEDLPQLLTDLDYDDAIFLMKTLA